MNIKIHLDQNIFHIINEKFSGEYISKGLKELKLFRKGPYKINHVFIPSQWNSFIKWQYLKNFINYIIKSLRQLKNDHYYILDIGANNGYYSFLLYYELKQSNIKSYFILIDPTDDFYQQFLFLKQFFPEEDQEHWQYYKIGWQDIKTLNLRFDCVLCMGIFYHHTDPYELLKTIHTNLNTGGILILETITIQYSEYPLCLIPEKKYANSSGIWFVPNKFAVMNFLKRANFRNIEFQNERFIVEEMNSLEYLPGLKDALTENYEFTIEGYPKPYRSFFTALK